MSAIELDFVDDLPEPRRRRDAAGQIVVRANGRPALITTTGDRYVAPDSHRAHGTHAKYVLEKCRCAPCTIASREYNRQLRSATDLRYVDAAPAREHVLAMMAAGCGYELQASVTGVPPQTYQNLLYGGWRIGAGTRTRRPPAKRIRPATADRILTFRAEQGTAVRVAVGSPKRVPALPLTRRWAALLDAGWWTAEASRVTGVDRQAFDRLTHRRAKYTSTRVADAIAHLEGLPLPSGKSRWSR